MIKEAITFALEKHGDQKYGDLPYIVHLYAVARHFDEEIMQVIALLHDILEGTETNAEELRRKFGAEVAEAVLILTHTEETYIKYILSIRNSNNPYAIAVKVADLRENLYAATYINREYQNLIARYQNALKILTGV